MKIKKIIMNIILAMLVIIGNISYSNTVSGSVDGVNVVNARGAEQSVSEIASYIYTFAQVVFIMVIIVGAIIFVWSVIKNIKGPNVDIAEVFITACQILTIIAILGATGRIAGYIIKGSGATIQIEKTIKDIDNK